MSKEDKQFLTTLQVNRSILIRNIIPCKDLLDKLTQQNVFPSSMIKEIQDCDRNEERNAKIVELLGIKGRGTILKFCDALQLSGHSFLSEFLRDEGAGDDQQIQHDLDRKDLAKKFPKLERLLPEGEREDLAVYIRGKVKKELIAASLRKQDDKEKVLNIRQNQLEESMKHHAILKEKEETIEQLQKSLSEAVVQVKNKELEVKHLSNYIEDLNKKHQKELETQMQFNLANDKSLQRMSDKDYKSSEILEDMVRKMQRCINDAGYTQRMKTPDRKKIPLTTLDKVSTLLAHLLDMVKELLEIREKYQMFQDERRIILVHLGIHNYEEKDLDFIGTFKKYVVTNEERVQGLEEQISELEEMVREKSTALQNTVSYQGLLDVLKADIALKDNMLQTLSEENSKLRNHAKTIHQQARTKNTGNNFRAVQHKRGTPFGKRSFSEDGTLTDEDIVLGGPPSAGVLVQTKSGGQGIQFQLASTRANVSAITNKKRNVLTFNGSKMHKGSQDTVLPPLSQSQAVSFKLTTGHNSRIKGPFLKKPMQVGATKISTSDATQVTVAEPKGTHYQTGNNSKLLQARVIPPGSRQVKTIGLQKGKPTFESRKISHLR